VSIQDLKGRKLKQKVHEFLKSPDFDTALEALWLLPARKVINPLLSFLYNSNDQVRWRAITAMGVVVSRLAEKDMESARVIMRRLMWNLNDESGGIGWGTPEAMGEILARHNGLAGEYASILLSYAREDGNFQEHELMQRGVLWGIGRVAQVRPDLVREAIADIAPFLRSPDATKRGLTAWIMGLLSAKEVRQSLMELINDETKFTIYLDRRLVERTVKEIAEEALSNMDHQAS